jgi:hypothetical protein
MSLAPSPWRDIRAALIEVFTKAAVDQITSEGGVHLPFETPAWAAEWKDRKVSFIHPLQGHALYLKVTTVVGRGWDESAFREFDTGLIAGNEASGETDVYEATSGLRRFTVQVQSYSLFETEELSSFDIIQRVCSRLDKYSSRQRLLEANVDLTDVGPTRDMTATVDKKRVSVTSVDFTFTACVIDIDPIPVGYFDRIILTSHEQADGEDATSSLRMIEETLPPDS